MAVSSSSILLEPLQHMQATFPCSNHAQFSTTIYASIPSPLWCINLPSTCCTINYASLQKIFSYLIMLVDIHCCTDYPAFSIVHYMQLL
jgi:hypothetical protein